MEKLITNKIENTCDNPQVKETAHQEDTTHTFLNKSQLPKTT